MVAGIYPIGEPYTVMAKKSSNLVLQGVSFFYSRVAEGTFYFKINWGIALLISLALIVT